MARRDGEKKLRMRGHPDWSLELLPLWLYKEGRKKEILAYLIGLCQAASAALLASAVILPQNPPEALLAYYIVHV